MKANIHPSYHSEIKVMCACGNSFTTGSTKEQIHVEVCYKCHPFFTGEQKFIDVAGRVEKFQKKQASAAQYKQTHVPKSKKKENKGEQQPKSLRELLGEV